MANVMTLVTHKREPERRHIENHLDVQYNQLMQDMRAWVRFLGGPYEFNLLGKKP